MDKDELIKELLAKVKEIDGVTGASVIDGEAVIGVEFDNGAEYFIELKDV